MVSLPLAPFKRLLKEANKGKPVSDGAVEYLAEFVEEKVLEVGRKASEFSQHRDAVTLEAKDVKLAIKTYKL